MLSSITPTTPAAPTTDCIIGTQPAGSRCQELIRSRIRKIQNHNDKGDHNTEQQQQQKNDNNNFYEHVISLGVLSESFSNQLETMIRAAVEPYTNNSISSNSSSSSSTCSTTATATTTTPTCPLNHFSYIHNPPNIILPGMILDRYQEFYDYTTSCSSSQQEQKQKQQGQGEEQHHHHEPLDTTTTTIMMKQQNILDFGNNMKQYAKDVLNQCLHRIENSWQNQVTDDQQQNNNNNNNNNKSNEYHYPTCVHEEEQGYLSVYVIVVPKRSIITTQGLEDDDKKQLRNNNNNNKARSSRQERRKKHHTTFDVPSQGGDPRSNLEKRILRDQVVNILQQKEDRKDDSTAMGVLPSPLPPSFWNMNQAIESFMTNTNDDQQRINNYNQETKKTTTMTECWWMKQYDSTTMATPTTVEQDTDPSLSLFLLEVDIHVAVWRRPYYLLGMYTKTRRDVSQTPFFVDEDDEDDDNNDDNVHNNNNNVEDHPNTGEIENENTNPIEVQVPRQTSPQNKRKRGRKRLGITSVEEVITQSITKYCNGISTRNNFSTTMTTTTTNQHDVLPPSSSSSTINHEQNSHHNTNNVTNHDVVYGMAKFHASGREDMDVRMVVRTSIPTLLLSTTSIPAFSTTTPPPPTTTTTGLEQTQDDNFHNNTNGTITTITGRPFVYEIIDANRMIAMESIEKIVHDINHTPQSIDKTDNNPSEHSQKCDGIGNNNNNIKHNYHLAVKSTTSTTTTSTSGDNDKDVDRNEVTYDSYGSNQTTGVGISPILQFVPAVTFKNLQNETEHKIKYYGCYCWSAKKLPRTNQDMMNQLGSSSASASSSYPLTIQQRTPLRVLHRRVNMIRIRHILTCSVQRINDHYFYLYISTDAGTYVKEFVHGDLGRTKPSISSFLGCQTDLLELDCMGIQS